MESTELFNTKPSVCGFEFFAPAEDDQLNPQEVPDKKWARCRGCHYKIALQSDKISINNTDTHIFENPAGIFYRVVYFTEAPGAANISDYTEENTWFAGCTWSITICRSCNNHLGWHYISESREFFGLIADRLTGI